MLCGGSQYDLRTIGYAEVAHTRMQKGFMDLGFVVALLANIIYLPFFT